MNFMDAYSSALSSENSKSDSQNKKLAQGYIQSSNLPTYVPFKSQPPNPGYQTAAQSYLTTQQLSYASGQAVQAAQAPKHASTSFTQLFDDAMYVFRKSALQAVELGIGEMIAQEKTRLTTELLESQRELQQSKEDKLALKKQNEEQQIQLLRYQEIMGKMAQNIAELKVYRADSLYGQRVMQAWHKVARHSAKSRDYENLLTDIYAFKQMRQLYMQWKFLAYRKSFVDLRSNFNAEIQKMADQREEYFAAERTKYEAKIEHLKREMSGFAIKEKKMKDAMKQAFLKGINAISEEATIAMDKSERLSMPQELRVELEDRFMADGGSLDDVELGSEEDGRTSAKSVKIAPNYQQGREKNIQQSPAEQEPYPEHASFEAVSLPSNYVEELNAVATAQFQQTNQFDHIVYQPIYVGSPAKPVAMHGIMGSQEEKIIGGPAQQAQVLKSDVKGYRVGTAKPQSNPNLAQRLKGQSGYKAHPSSMIYKESVKQVGQRVKVEKE